MTSQELWQIGFVVMAAICTWDFVNAACAKSLAGEKLSAFIGFLLACPWLPLTIGLLT